MKSRAIELYYTPEQVASIIGMHPKTVILKLKAGEFGRDGRVVDLIDQSKANPTPGKKPKERHDYRIAASAVNDWLDARRVFSELDPIPAASVSQLRRKAEEVSSV